MKKNYKSYWDVLLLFIFIIIAGSLRFYNITKLQFFTFDQSRDALFVKRIVVDHNLRLLGTQTSLPGMFLPPFYYYTIAPILWVFRLNPVGIDIYAATIGVLMVPLIFFVSNKIFGRPAGIFSAGLLSVSSFMVELTRRAWNPNTLPFFILISFYFLYLYFKKGQSKNLLFSIAVYGYCLSLHFGAWTLLPLFIFSVIRHLVNYKDIRTPLVGGSILLLSVSPVILFNLRHHFLLLDQAKNFFITENHLALNLSKYFESCFVSLIAVFSVLISGKLRVGYGAPLPFEGSIKQFFGLREPISFVAQDTFSISVRWWGMMIFVFITIAVFYNLLGKVKQKHDRLPLIMILVWLIWGILVSRFLQSSFFFFYYLYLFPIPFLLFGFLFKKISLIKFFSPLAFIGLFLIIVFHLRHTTVFAQQWRDFSDLKNTASVIANNAQGESFNIATIQRDSGRWDRNSVDYRYFVETYEKKKPLDWMPEDYRKSKILFVVDETGKVDVLNSPIMEIKEFKPKAIVGRWTIEKGIVIYKLSKNEI